MTRRKLTEKSRSLINQLLAAYKPENDIDLDIHRILCETVCGAR